MRVCQFRHFRTRREGRDSGCPSPCQGRVKQGQAGSRQPRAGSAQLRQRPTGSTASERRVGRPRARGLASTAGTAPHRPTLVHRARPTAPKHESPGHRARSQGLGGSPEYRLDPPHTVSRVGASLVFLRCFPSDREDRSVLKISPVFGVQYVRNPRPARLYMVSGSDLKLDQ